MDSMEIGSTPHGESCAQVGTPNYSVNAKRKCRAYINQLVRVYGEPPVGTSLVIKANPHDFGTYYEVAVKFHEWNDYVSNVEEGCEFWDEAAKQELAGTTMKLVYKTTKQPVKVGDIVTNFRGETATVIGWQEPKHSGSTGRIDTDYGSFYPSVYDCEWQAVVNVQRK